MMAEREGDWTPEHEPDRVPWKPVALVMAIFLVLMGGGLAWVALLGPRSPAVPAVATEAVPVRHGLYGEESAARELAEAHRRTLETFGWIDRDSGLVRIPIDRAMRIVAAGDERQDVEDR